MLQSAGRPDPNLAADLLVPMLLAQLSGGGKMEPRMRTKQELKYHLSLAGEFYVAAELQRRGLHASVVYGNAKSTDVVAFFEASSRAAVVEVKSTAQSDWVVGDTVPAPSDKPWVFVRVPTDVQTPPRFFVMTQRELHDILTPGDLAYRERFKAKHGVEFKKGVVTLTLKEAEPHANQWEKILVLADPPSGDAARPGLA